MLHDDVLALRLVAQGLVGPPQESVTDAVSRLLAVSDPDSPVRGVGVALRSRATTADTLDALAAGTVVRTHVLRPTWHMVAAEDLPWLRELMSAKSRDAMTTRERQLDLDEQTRKAALASFASALADGPLSRRDLQVTLQREGVLGECSMLGRQVGHLLLAAELDGAVVARPSQDGGHTYALASDVPGDAPSRSRQSAVDELLFRFVASHGPVSVADILRWVNISEQEVATALAENSRIASTDVDGVTLWFDAEAVEAATPHLAKASEATLLLPSFDEAIWAYNDVSWPLVSGTLGVPSPTNTAGGVVISRLRIAGKWKATPTVAGIKMTVSITNRAHLIDYDVIHNIAANFATKASPGAPIGVIIE